VVPSSWQHPGPITLASDTGHVLAEIGIPILFLHGSHDTTVPVWLATRGADQLDHAQVAVIAGAGHMAHVDEPDQWIAALERFLTQ
jgi:pimeloyl-ACP methyl ester carboxylesterase